MKTRKKITFEVLVVIERDGDEFYAHCPSLKGLHTTAKTKAEIMTNAANAIVAYIESLIKHGDPIPLGIRKKDDRPAPVCFARGQANLIQVSV